MGRRLSVATALLIGAVGACQFDPSGVSGASGTADAAAGPGGEDAAGGGGAVDGGSADAAVDSGVGGLDATAQQADAGVVIGESCASPGTMRLLGAGETLVVHGDTSGVGADAPPTSGCSGEPQHPDQVVWLRTEAAGQLTIELESDGWNSALEVRIGDCEDPTSAKCTQNAPTNSLSDPVAAGEDVYAWVDGGNAGSGIQSGAYKLTARLQSP